MLPKTIAIISARYNSSRFPGKPLADLCGKPMIWRDYTQARNTSSLEAVYVANDDLRIGETCKKYGIPSIMTSFECKSSTERAYEVAL